MKEVKPFFSIIIPHYKTEPFLEQCLKSLKNQTFKNFEVVVINDSSPGVELEYFQEKNKFYRPEINIEGVEKTEQGRFIFDKLVGEDKRFIFKTKENEGQGPARNYAIYNLAKGERIVFLDADDWLDDDYLQKAFETISLNQGIFYASMRHYKNDTNDFESLKQGQKFTPWKNNLKTLLAFPTWGMNQINYFPELSLIKKYNLKVPNPSAEDVIFRIDYILAFIKENKEIKPNFHYINSCYNYRLFPEQGINKPDFMSNLFLYLSDYSKKISPELKNLNFTYYLIAKISQHRYWFDYKRKLSKSIFYKVYYNLLSRPLTALNILISHIF